jgi:hypothetical protein
MASSTTPRASNANRLPWLLPLLAWLMLLIQGAVAAAAADEASKDLTTIAILDFKLEKVSVETASGVSDSLDRYLSASDRFRLWNRTIVNEAARSIMEHHSEGRVCEEIGCAVEVGIEIGCNTVIVGSVSRFGKLVTISARAIDVNSEAVAGAWAAESFTGEAGVPAAVRDLAEQMIASGGMLPRGEVRLRDTGRKENLVFEDFETSSALGAGLGIQGLESTRHTCAAGDEATTCYENTARLNWLAEIGLWARLKNSRWSLGFRAGGVSAKTTWTIRLETSSYSDFARGTDSGFNYYLCPLLGYVLYESRAARVMAAAGAGYRDFSDESQVDKAFSSAGLSVRVLSIRLDLAHWHGFDSESLLKNMVTISLGFGTGY